MTREERALRVFEMTKEREAQAQRNFEERRKNKGQAEIRDKKKGPPVPAKDRGRVIDALYVSVDALSVNDLFNLLDEVVPANIIERVLKDDRTPTVQASSGRWWHSRNTPWRN